MLFKEYIKDRDNDKNKGTHHSEDNIEKERIRAKTI